MKGGESWIVNGLPKAMSRFGLAVRRKKKKKKEKKKKKKKKKKKRRR